MTNIPRGYRVLYVGVLRKVDLDGPQTNQWHEEKGKLSVKRSFSILDCGGCITVHEYAGCRYGEHVLSLSGVCHHRRGGPSPKNLMHGDIPRDRIRDTKWVTATWHSGSTPRYVLCR